YVVGATNGTDFPVTRNAFQGSGAPNLSGRVGGLDAFLVVLNTNPQPLAAPNGNQLLYGTYLGGSGADVANGVAVNVPVQTAPHGTPRLAAQAFVYGTTASLNFPKVNAIQNSFTAGGHTDAFLTVFDRLPTNLTDANFLTPQVVLSTPVG